MSLTQPELVHVAGPQQGQELLLSRELMLAGRSPAADIVLEEEYISRQQMRFAPCPQGWLVENLSDSRPLEINGKRFKQGKQILLDTGDVIGAGLETKLLFVGAGDDVSEAVRAYHEQFASSEPQPVPVAPPPEEPAPMPEPVAPSPVEPPAPTEAPDGEPAEAGKPGSGFGKKKKIYLIGFGVYLLAMVGLVVFLSAAKQSNRDKGNSEMPSVLTAEQIETYFTSELERSVNAQAAARALDQARNYYAARNAEPGNLYLTLLHYRLSLAHRRPADRVLPVEDDRNYEQVKDKLLLKVVSIYSEGVLRARGSRWVEAYQNFERLLQIVPIADAQEDPAVRQKFLRNVQDFQSYVAKKIPEDRRRR